MKIGDRFGKLTVVNILGPRGGQLLVRCDCGVEKQLRRALVVSGNTSSCGCGKVDDAKKRFTTHGHVKKINGKRIATPEYRSWQLMRNRCLNQTSTDYKYYGGRGITIDRAWDKFESFLADMGLRPDKGFTLDRIDSDGPYTKANCRWATRQTQARNRKYACTKTWELAEQLGVKVSSAAHYIWMVRAKDKGITKGVTISIEREKIVRNFLKQKD